MKIKASSTTANISVASVALQAEIDECYQRLISGEIHFVSAATGACGHLGAKEMAVSGCLLCCFYFIIMYENLHSLFLTLILILIDLALCGSVREGASSNF